MVGVTALEVRILQGQRHPDLVRFLTMFDNLGKALSEIDRAVVTERSTRPNWVVDDLRHAGREFTVRLTAQQTNRRPTASLLLPVAALVAGAQALREEPEVPRYYTEGTISRLTSVAAAPESGIETVELATVNGAVGPFVALDGVLVAHAREAVQEAEMSIGSITGRLDAIKRSDNRCTLTIVNPWTHRAVSGSASLDMADELREAWGHHVTVRGRITRNARGQAFRIAAASLERLPDDDNERTRATAMNGIAPDWTGGTSVDRYMEQARRRA